MVGCTVDLEEVARVAREDDRVAREDDGEAI